MLAPGICSYFFQHPERADFLDRVKRVVDMLADTPVRNFWISLDSAVPEVHEKMRGFPGIINGIEKALPLFHDAGLYPAVNLGMNRMLAGKDTSLLSPAQFPDRNAYLDVFETTFRKGMCRFYDQALRLGFTMANTCYPMSMDDQECKARLAAVYAAASPDRIVAFDRDEKARLFRVLIDVVQKYRSQLRIFSPCVSLHSLYRYYSEDISTRHSCRGGYDYFFVSAQDGDTYPCGYRGTRNLGKFWELRESLLDRAPSCTLCDWECFRDPSELIGMSMDAVFRPWRLVSDWQHDPRYVALWWRDLRYFRACSFFDGRQPLTKDRLAEYE